MRVSTHRHSFAQTRTTSRSQPRSSGKAFAEQKDLVESIFGGLFGKKALEDPAPAGLKRMTVEKQPEAWPAVVDKWAEPMEGDSEMVSLIRPLLAQTQLETKPLRLAYDANKNGWNAQAFHKAVDGFGATIVFARTENGSVIGGYNPKGWIGMGEERDAIAAFLFTWYDGDVTQMPVKLPKAGGPSIAVIDRPNEGILFGAEGLHIALSAADPKLAKCRLGSYYEKLPNGDRSLFPMEAEDGTTKGRRARVWKVASAQLTELYAFVAVGDGEKWDLDGIVWKTEN